MIRCSKGKIIGRGRTQGNVLQNIPVYSSLLHKRIALRGTTYYKNNLQLNDRFSEQKQLTSKVLTVGPVKTGSNNARWVRNPVFCSAGIPPILDLPWLLPCGKSRSSVSSKYKPIKQGENSLRLLEKWHHILVALASTVVIVVWNLNNALACSH